MALPLHPAQHPDTEVLPSDELSSVASNATEFADLYEQSTSLLRRYQSQHETDPGSDNAVLRAAIEYLPMHGKCVLMKEIISFHEDWDKQRQLAHFFIDAILKPMQLRGPPPDIRPSPTPEATEGIQTLMVVLMDSSRRRRSVLKEMCLRRDGYCCVVSDRPDMHAVLNGRVQHHGRTPATTKCAHIIPFDLRKFNEDDPHDMEKAATVWWALYRYFPDLEGLLESGSINKPENAMTLESTIHDLFDDLYLGLEPSHEHADMYGIRIFADIPFPLPQTITLRSRQEAVPLPRSELLRVRFTVASILHVSGIGARIGEFLDPEFWDTTHGAAAADGSTDLAALVKRKMLIGV